MKVCQDVRTGRFDPDSTRSGRWIEAHPGPSASSLRHDAEQVHEAPILNEAQDEQEDGDDGSSCSSSNSDQTSETCEISPSDEAAHESFLACHLVSGVVHCYEGADNLSFKCGRVRSHKYIEREDAVPSGARYCKRCFSEDLYD